jgi:hypothetical protein
MRILKPFLIKGRVHKMKLTRNYFRKTLTTYSDGYLTVKWSFISVNASFYVSPTNVNHFPQVMTYMDINWK